MSRNRTIYQCHAVYAGVQNATGEHTGANAPLQLHRVQSANYNFNIARQDINQFGQLAAIGREITTAPTVSLDLSYYVTNAYNESGLGFVVDGSVSAISGLLSKVTDEKNYFILTTPEGSDAVNNTGATTSWDVIGIGNAFLTSYSTEGAVGGIPTATVRFEALNLKVDSDVTGNDIPAVNPVNGLSITGVPYELNTAISGQSGQATALRPGDITVTITPSSETGTMGVGVDILDSKIQSYTLSFDLAREPLEKLGSRFAFSREIRFPVTATAAIDASVGDLTTGNLADVLCNDKTYDITIDLRKPNCTGVGELAVQYKMLNTKLDSQNFTNSIGANDRVTLNFSAQLGSAEDVANGFFMSGIVIE